MAAQAKARSGAAGFGFRPEESEHHFVVTVPAANRADVSVSEHLRCDPEGAGFAGAGAGSAERRPGGRQPAREGSGSGAPGADSGPGAGSGSGAGRDPEGGGVAVGFPGLDPAGTRLRAALPRAKWNAIADDVRVEFNRRLRKEGLPAGRWRTGRNPLARLLGKELTLLAWAIEDADPALVPAAIRNWLGLSPEERWWLFTMTAAATGHAVHGRGRGWRKAVRFALTENPVDAAAPPREILSDTFRLRPPDERRPRAPRRRAAGARRAGAGKGGR